MNHELLSATVCGVATRAHCRRPGPGTGPVPGPTPVPGPGAEGPGAGILPGARARGPGGRSLRGPVPGPGAHTSRGPEHERRGPGVDGKLDLMLYNVMYE